MEKECVIILRDARAGKTESENDEINIQTPTRLRSAMQWRRRREEEEDERGTVDRSESGNGGRASGEERKRRGRREKYEDESGTVELERCVNRAVGEGDELGAWLRASTWCSGRSGCTWRTVNII